MRTNNKVFFRFTISKADKDNIYYTLWVASGNIKINICNYHNIINIHNLCDRYMWHYLKGQEEPNMYDSDETKEYYIVNVVHVGMTNHCVYMLHNMFHNFSCNLGR